MWWRKRKQPNQTWWLAFILDLMPVRVWNEGWLPTLLLLRDYEIPSLFTALNEAEMTYSLQILLELENGLAGKWSQPLCVSEARSGWHVSQQDSRLLQLPLLLFSWSKGDCGV
ncbi:Putative protein MSS51-like protein, mitochondrial [Larimichthys crocea]|uniref:Uncharacterized protein n=1 Tax=Larimichthys crocea TaxID=215358 RepID=A0ACD3RRH7_LARCR|nr:Putative protein MSS51-like protein, mitochondrial [Larimichthys crocea]